MVHHNAMTVYTKYLSAALSSVCKYKYGITILEQGGFIEDLANEKLRVPLCQVHITFLPSKKLYVTSELSR